MRLVIAFVSAASLLSAQTAFVRSASGQFQTPGPVSFDCSVDGFVVNAVTGEPIPRAQVMYMASGQTSSMPSDSSGRWHFSNIACGQLQIAVSRPGFLPGNAGLPRMGSAFHPVILAPGSSTHDIKVPLTPQAVAVGKVIDDQGDPVQNVQVSALVSRVVQGKRTFQMGGQTTTNDLGEYRLANLQAGKYILCARAPLSQFNGIVGGETTLGESCYPGPADGGSAGAMQMMPGADSHIDFTLTRVPVVHVSGQLSGLPKGQGVGLMLSRRGSAGGGVARQTNIQPDGKFQIAGVTAGSYLLSADYWEAGKRLSARVPVEVGTSDVQGIEVHLDQGFSVTGTLRFESKTPPQNLQFNINLHSADGQVAPGGVVWNPDHLAFTIPDVIPASYRLDGFISGKFYLKSALLAGRDLTREDVPIGQGAGPIDVVLSDESGTIEGDVTDSSDQPAPGSWVMILAEGRQPRNMAADLSGHFKLAGLAPGEYTLYAWDDVQDVEYADPEWLRRFSGVRVSVQGDQTAQARLRQMTAAQ